MGAAPRRASAGGGQGAALPGRRAPPPSGFERPLRGPGGPGARAGLSGACLSDSALASPHGQRWHRAVSLRAVTGHWFPLPESCEHDPGSRQSSSSAGLRRQWNQACHCFREGKPAEPGGTAQGLQRASPLVHTVAFADASPRGPAHREVAEGTGCRSGCETCCRGGAEGVSVTGDRDTGTGDSAARSHTLARCTWSQQRHRLWQRPWKAVGSVRKTRFCPELL